MKPLVTNYLVFKWLCICPPEEPNDWRKKLAYFLSMLIISFINITFVISSAFFIRKVLSVDLEDTLFAFAQFASFSGITYLIIAAVALRHSITGLFGSLSRIYDESRTIFSQFFFVYFNFSVIVVHFLLHLLFSFNSVTFIVSCE